MESIQTDPEPATAPEEPAAIDPRFNGKKYDILFNNTNAFAIHYIFNTNGTISCNQTMFDKAPYTILNKNEWDVARKNGSKVLWRWKSETEAFRVDKPVYSMRLAK